MSEKVRQLLIIEDEETLREALADQCRREGFEVSLAKDGETGLKYALEYHPDCILLDVMLPDMNGIELLQQLRKDEWGKNACVLTLTNMSDEELVQKATEMGASGYLIKSDIGMEELMIKLKGILQK